MTSTFWFFSFFLNDEGQLLDPKAWEFHIYIYVCVLFCTKIHFNFLYLRSSRPRWVCSWSRGLSVLYTSSKSLWGWGVDRALEVNGLRKKKDRVRLSLPPCVACIIMRFFSEVSEWMGEAESPSYMMRWPTEKERVGRAPPHIYNEVSHRQKNMGYTPIIIECILSLKTHITHATIYQMYVYGVFFGNKNTFSELVGGNVSFILTLQNEHFLYPV